MQNKDCQKLRNCPFCGSKDLFAQLNAWPRFIKCWGCMAEARSTKNDEEGRDDVIAKWNRRVSDE